MQPTLNRWRVIVHTEGRIIYKNYLEFCIVPHPPCMGLAKTLVHKMLQKNLNGSFGQPNISSVPCGEYFLKVWTWILKTLDYNPIALSFVAAISPDFATGSSFSCRLCTYDISPLLWGFSKISLLSGTRRCFRVILYFSCPSLGIRYPSQEPWFHWIELILETKIYTRCAGCHWDIIAFQAS